MKIIEGGICAVGDVLAGGACEDEFGVAVILLKDSNASAVFTSNKLVAAPVIVTREAVSNGKLSAIVANSGNANCFTGTDGMEDAMSFRCEGCCCIFYRNNWKKTTHGNYHSTHEEGY
jgi:glutamate N-acetyltransferase/amino-acid N-acetyltransferase